jgi:DNA-binding SARP family transcriptional activator
LRVYLLGRFRVQVEERTVAEDAWPRQKVKSLLKLLALAPGHALHRDQILEALWPDLSPAAAANNFYRVLHLLRRVLEPGLAAGADSR